VITWQDADTEESNQSHDRNDAIGYEVEICDTRQNVRTNM